MRPTKWLVHEGRVLEVRYHRVGTNCQVWIYEGEQPIKRYSTVSLYEAAARMAHGGDLIRDEMENAARDVETGRLALA